MKAKQMTLRSFVFRPLRDGKQMTKSSVFPPSVFPPKVITPGAGTATVAALTPNEGDLQ